MLKFIVVVYKHSDWTTEQFREYFQKTHGALAKQLPGLRQYVQNFVATDTKRKHPGWDVVSELYFDNWEAMEATWASPEGKAATEDLAVCADLERTTWSVVEDITVIYPGSAMNH